MATLTLREAVDRFCRECNGEMFSGKHFDCLGNNCALYPWKKGKGVYQNDVVPDDTHLAWLEKHGTGVRKKKSAEACQALSERMRLYWQKKNAEGDNSLEDADENEDMVQQDEQD